MKTTRFIFIYISLMTILPGCFAFKQTEPIIKYHFVDQQGHICPQIEQILALTDIIHDGSLSDIVEKTQEAWLRKPGVERWQINKLITKHESQLQKLFNEMEMYQEIKPNKQHFKYLLVLGALFKRMEQRFDYAINLHLSGIRFDNIVLLAGARPCVADQGENLETFLKFCKKDTLDRNIATEMDMLKLIYDYSNMPETMRQIPIQIIDVPMLQKADGTLQRPTTADTVTWWLQTNPTPGNCLAISNQPYVFYQDSVFKTLLPTGYEIETVGAACAQDENLAVMFDTLARILYQELQRYNMLQRVN